MTKNKLYFFIKNELNFLRSDVLKKECFVFKTNKEGNNYLFYDLTVAKEQSFLNEEDRYQLLSHHVSFYETQVATNPYLSQYHYTAYLSNQLGEHYQIHVYFDQNDQLTTEPVFAIEKEAGQLSRQCISQELTEHLSQFAINETFALIAEIRQQHQLTLDTLKVEFNSLENKLTALSLELATNHEQYKFLLGDAEKFLIPLALYHPNGQYYEAIASLFKKMSNSLTKTIQINTTHPNERKEEEKSALMINTTPSRNSKKTRRRKKQSLSAALKKADAAMTTFDSSNEEPLDQQVTHFRIFEDLVRKALSLTINKDDLVNVQDLQQIKMLLSEVTIKGKKLLESLLLNKQFNLADSVKHFTLHIPDTYIKMALRIGNAELLDFLLTHGRYAINTFFIVEGKENFSLVRYCVEKNDPKYPKVDCLAVLIKHNASLMVKGSDGLPIAYHVALTEHFQWTKALPTIITQPQFYKTLLTALKTKLFELDTGEPLYKQLLQGISACQYQIDFLNGRRESATNIRSENDLNNAISKLSNVIPRSTIESLKADIDVQQAYDKFLLVGKDFLKNINNTLRRQCFRKAQAHFENLEQVLSLIDLDSIDAKQELIKNLTNLTQILELKLELDDVQKELRVPHGRRKLNHLYARQASLLAKIQELSQPHITANNFAVAMNEMLKASDEKEVSQPVIKSVAFESINQSSQAKLIAELRDTSAELENLSNSDLDPDVKENNMQALLKAAMFKSFNIFEPNSTTPNIDEPLVQLMIETVSKKLAHSLISVVDNKDEEPEEIDSNDAARNNASTSQNQTNIQDLIQNSIFNQKNSGETKGGSDDFNSDLNKPAEPGNL